MSASESMKMGAAPKQTRSRNGCRECRRLHRRCDEQHPSCHHCLSAGKQCSYAKNLSWGGRSFGKSQFGKALAAGVVPVHSDKPNADAANESQSFVYSMTSSYASDISRRTYRPSSPSPLYPTPNWSSWMPPEQRSLIDHFTHNLTPCFTLCQTQHDNFCSIFLPLALDATHGTPLRAAILLSALVHQNSFGSAESDVRCASLYQSCIRHLRENAIGDDARIDDVYVATALILCLTDMLAGEGKPGAWRLHLNGAAASLDKNISNVVAQTRSSSSTRLFLWRWCRSLRTVALSSAQHAPSSTELHIDLDSSEAPCCEYIDAFDGFSTDLLPIFREINELAMENRAIGELEESYQERPPSIGVLRSMLRTRSNRLISRVKSMSTKPVSTLDPTIPISQHNANHIDFVSLNEACHHTALLEIYQRVLDKPQKDLEVQEAVESGINCLKRMTLNEGASPGVATLHPVFIIGCAAATVEDRLFVMDWLENMKKRYSMGNVQSAKFFLLELWQRNDALLATGSHIQWDKLMYKNWDLSLY